SINSMLSTFLSCFLTAAAITPVSLTIVTAPPDSRTDFSLSPSGRVEVRREATVTRVKTRVEPVEPLQAFGPQFQAYVVWTVTADGRFATLGELEVRGRRAEVEATTSLQEFGVLITAEPHHLVDAPSSNVAFRSVAPDDSRVRSWEAIVQVGERDYCGRALPPQGAVSPRVTQARAAYVVAEPAAGDIAPAAIRPARVALDSMEELLRRGVPSEIL